MKSEDSGVGGPRGGLRAAARATRGWHWDQRGLVSAPVRCKRAQWYLARGRLARGAGRGGTEVMVRFVHSDRTVSARSLTLHAVAQDSVDAELLGWVQGPEDATHLQLQFEDSGQAGRFAEIVLHPVGERDPKCHPLANVPRWGSYRPPFPLERVLLPPELADLAGLVVGQEVEILRPRSVAHLARTIRGVACVFDPGWEAEFGLQWRDLARLAADAWLIVDLETVWKLVRRSGLARVRLVPRESAHGIMSARVEYGDVATRGFALQDVFPYATVTTSGGFGVRVLRPDQAWERYADREGFATLLASETPDPDECGDILSAAWPMGGGELIATDLPWMVAGRLGALLAPRLARHALGMHLGGPLDDNVQYWNRWDEDEIVVRDISDLARRYPPLRAIRWSTGDEGLVRLGVALPPLRGVPSRRALLLRTGRIDNLAVHDGLPPEPMIIFMKMLAREVREGTAWAARHLRDLTVIWQFDTAAGLRYASNYASAAAVVAGQPRAVGLARVRAGVALVERGTVQTVPITSGDVGVFGDGALDYQAQLDARLRALIEQASE